MMKLSEPRRRLPLTLLLLLPPLYLLFHPHLPTAFPRAPPCPHSVVYNKPHKTAGTKIQHDIVAWAARTHWHAVTCSPFEPNIQLHECLPALGEAANPAEGKGKGCVIVANHMVLNPALERLLERRLGSVLWMTSTRSGRERRLSHYLQINKLKHTAAANDQLKRYLRTANPWSDYNYMTGELRSGECPVTWADKQLISEMVSRYDVVIDADLPEVSNVILSHYGLFQLTDDQVNVRGAGKLQLDEEGEQLVEKVACVDEEMHRQFRIRMGSLYQMITGVPCNNRTKDATPCF